MHKINPDLVTGEFTCKGTARGWCRTIHQTLKAAEDHIAEDGKAAALAGLATDRTVTVYSRA